MGSESTAQETEGLKQIANIKYHFPKHTPVSYYCEKGSNPLLGNYSTQMLMYYLLRQILSFRNFFNEDPGYRLQARAGITSDSMLTVTNPESHAHPSFVNVVTMSLNVANAMNIVSVALPHVLSMAKRAEHSARLKLNTSVCNRRRKSRKQQKRK